MSAQRAYIADRLYVPRKSVSSSVLEEFEHKILRHEQEPETVRTYRKLKKKGLIGFPIGDQDRIDDIFGLVEDDRRILAPFPFPGLRFTSTLRPEQEKVAKEWLAAGHGIVRAPTRWGKAVLMVYLVVTLGMRALVLADGSPLAKQMLDEFYKHTNLRELEKLYKRKLIGRYSAKSRRFYPITVSTYKIFLKPQGKRDFSRAARTIGTTWVTEAHQVGARRYSQILSSVHSYFRGGDTATPKRKDGRHAIMHDVLGQVTGYGKRQQLSARVTVIETGTQLPSNRGKRRIPFNNFLAALVNDFDRNELILDRVMQDFDDGKSVLVTTDRRAHAVYLTKLLRASGYNAEYLIGRGHKNAYNEELIEKCKNGSLKILVAMRQMVRLGIDVPPWESLHVTLPSANPPNFEQEIGRVRTPWPGHTKDPVIRYYLDDGGPSQACLNIARKVFNEFQFPVEFDGSSADEYGSSTKLSPNKPKAPKGLPPWHYE